MSIVHFILYTIFWVGLWHLIHIIDSIVCIVISKFKYWRYRRAHQFSGSAFEETLRGYNQTLRDDLEGTSTSRYTSQASTSGRSTSPSTSITPGNLRRTIGEARNEVENWFCSPSYSPAELPEDTPEEDESID